MEEFWKYGLYFLIGGLVVSFSTYLGAKGEGFLAALASTFPAITGLTFMLIYVSGSGKAGPQIAMSEPQGSANPIEKTTQPADALASTGRSI